MLGARAWRFGIDRGDLAIHVRSLGADGSAADVVLPDGQAARLRLQVPGIHNLRNATAALGVVVALGAPVEPAVAALHDFTGVGRRFERLGETNGVTLVDDYAHHPTELVATLAAARQAFPGRRIVAVFQPHLYSRTREHAHAMGEALAAADIAVVADVYGAREAPVAGITGQLVADAAVAAGGMVVYEPSRPALAARTAELLREGDVLLTMGAGDVTQVGRDVRALRERV
jgi:UDP-N-acetylmuramate--alanine ligase